MVSTRRASARVSTNTKPDNPRPTNQKRAAEHIKNEYDDSESDVPHVKRRRTVKPHISAGNSGVASPASFEFSRDGTIDTPATSISDQEMDDAFIKDEEGKYLPTSTKGKGKTRVEIPASEGEETDPLTAPESDEEGIELIVQSKGKGKQKAIVSDIGDSDFEDDESDFEPEVFKPSKKKGKGNAVITVINNSEEESEFDSDDAESLESEYDSEGEPVLPVVPTPAPTIVAPQPRRGRGRRFSRMSRADRDRSNLYMVHPELENIFNNLDNRPRITVEEDPQPPGLSLSLLPFQKEGLHWLRLQEQSDFRGGILADEMGMGKTIQTLSLIMMDPKAKPNLVVAPTVAIMQWKSEIEKYTGTALSVYVFHGSSKTTDHKELAKHNVILTTYNLLESVFRKQESGFKRKAGLYKEKSALHKISYHRVILDEAHNIKDRSCNTAKAVFALQTKYKLCLSGTPLQNRIGELFSLLRFLELDPFAYYFCRKCNCKSLHWKFSNHRNCDDCGHPPMSHLCFFNYACLKPIQNNGNEGEGAVAFQNIHKLMKHIMLRRTKKEREEDLGLPPKVVRIRRDNFSEEELDLYDSIYSDGKRKFDTYVAQGVVLNNYANIFTLITRMRQMADHPDLVLRKHAEDGQNTLVCGICDDEAEEAIKSKCHHTFCRDCVQRYVAGFDGDTDPECPKCHISLIIDLTQPALEVDGLTLKKNSIISRIDMSKWRSSTKIEALCEELYKLRSPHQTTKSIVFSQFTSMLQLIEWRLNRAGFKTVMLEGSMSPSQREATINHFMNNVDVEVFLVSLKAGGVALNLIEANQVFLMEPWWNPSVEWQAADRIHRIGQTRVCRVTRMVIQDSIESRIIELQEKKTRMIEATVNADQKAMERLTPADMQFLFQN